ncbi:unnamed protein product [Closterium sp. NIES-54]
MVAASCSCRLLSHQTLLWHHRLGHPSLPRLRGMHSRLLVSGLPRSVPPLPPSPAPPCLPCVEGRQRAAPHSSSFPPTTALLHILHMDVWGPAGVSGLGRKRYFLLVFDDYTRYTTVFPLRSKGPSCFALHIGLVMEVARTSMIHAAAPHFLWPFAVRYVEHQLNLWPRVSLPETSPTLRWTRKVGNVSVFQVWGFRAFVHDTSADKLSSRAISCVFLGFPPDAPGWQLYHPTLRRVLPSQDVTFDELVPFYRLFLYRSAPPLPPPLFLAPGPPPVNPLPPLGLAPSGVSQVDPLPGTAPVKVAVRSGAAPGAASGGAERGGAGSEGAGSGDAEPGGEEPGGAEPEGVEPQGAESEGAESGGAEPGGATLSGGLTGARDAGAGGAGVIAGSGGTGGTASAGPGGARTRGVEAAGTGGVEGAGAGDATEPGAAGAGGAGVVGTGAGGAGAAGAGAVDHGAGGTGGTAATGLGGARTSGVGAIGTSGVGCAGAGDPTELGAAGAGGAGAAEAGVGGTSAGGAGAAGAGAVDPGAGGAGGIVRLRPYFVPLLQQVLDVPPSTGLTPSLVCPPPYQLRPPLQPATPLPAPSPYTEQSGGLTQRRELASRPILAVRTARRAPRSGPPHLPNTQAMALCPSFIPLRVPLPAPPGSSLPEVPDPESDRARAASPTVSRLFATIVTDPSFESAAASALVAELLDFAAAAV